MNYQELLDSIKPLFIERLKKEVKIGAYVANPLISQENYLDTVYTDIMSLGYNMGDIEKATNDIFETHSIILGDTPHIYKQLKFRVEETERLYKNGEPFEIVIEKITALLK